MNVLITDGNFRHTLAAVRSLGKRGIHVAVLSDLRPSISFFSKYCKDHRIAPNPEHDEHFSDFVLDLVKHERYDILLPISYAAVSQISMIRDQLERYVNVPIADRTSIQIAGDKNETAQCAEKLGIPIPKTFHPASDDDVRDLSRNLTYPVVVKGSVESGHVRYANSSEELMAQYRAISKYSPVIQEYVQGDGYGFFALYNHGEVRAFFMHRRLREYPVTGGPSSLAESIYDPVLKELGLRILDHLDWHGVAMVEFKRNRIDDCFVLIEINPKFWGSLELAIASGVDFPYLTCRMALEGDIEPVLHYQTGVKFRWLLPADIFHAITNPSMLPRFFMDFGDRSIRYDIDPHDLGPNIVQLGMTFAEILLRMKQGRFWRPDGRPNL